jgi:hypothetical protein
MSQKKHFSFSQGSLQDFVDCPRRFQLKYIEELAWPAQESEPALENERYLQQGTAFHRLVQQYFQGISAEKLKLIAAQEPNLIGWWDNFLASLEYLDDLKDHPTANVYPEISLSTPIGGFRLLGKYDLLIISEDKFSIYDWKTSRRQPKREWLTNSLQTRVYPYLLAKAGAYLNHGKKISPLKIKIVYWFANFPTSPLTYLYNDAKYNEDQRYIENLIEEINQLDESPALMTEDKKRCRFCVYRSLCNRGTKAGHLYEHHDTAEQDKFNLELDFEQIAEIEF